MFQGKHGRIQTCISLYLILILTLKGVVGVRAERAMEIIGSMRYIDVAYQGTPVYIQSVNKETGAAEVMPCRSNESMEVPVNELEEIE